MVRRPVLPAGLAGPALAAAILLACAPAPTAEEDLPVPPGAIRGQLVTSMFDFSDHSEVRHTLRLASGQERELRFQGTTPELPAGGTVDVWGSDDGTSIRVSRLAAVRSDDLFEGRSALINGTKKPAKRWAFVLVQNGTTANLTNATANTKLFGDTPSSIKTYYHEVSYGLQDLAGDVVGPLPFDPANAPGGLCQNFQVVGQALRPMIQGTYDQYLFYFLSPLRGCPWGGVAILGTAAKPTRDSYYNAAAECVVLVQEPGHNFGMVHSSALRCSKGGVPVSMVDPDDPNGGSCQHDEYGNSFDPMGGGNPGSGQMLGTCYHMNGIQKAYQDWLEGCNIVKAGTTGTYTIYPLENACNGTQLLQIPLPTSRRLDFPPSAVATITAGTLTSYYLEYRTPVGLDRALTRPRVFVLAAGNLKDARLRGNANWLIDTTPDTRTVNDADLAVGATFTDPAPNGPKFTVVSADATKAVISVQLNGEAASTMPGNGTCSDDTPFTGPGVATCEATAGSGGAPGSGGTGGAGGDGAGGAGQGGTGGGPDMPPVIPDAGAPDGSHLRAAADADDTSPDAQVPPVAQVVHGGCSCHVGGQQPAAWPLVLAIVLVGRRMTRHRRARAKRGTPTTC
jgi:MYXO-CTERM domain-containing protein